jgi:hypothetical protein
LYVDLLAPYSPTRWDLAVSFIDLGTALISFLALIIAVVVAIFVRKQMSYVRDQTRLILEAFVAQQGLCEDSVVVARQQLELLKRQHHDAMMPRADIFDWEVDEPYLLRSDASGVSGSVDDKFDATKNFEDRIGYRVYASIFNVGQRPLYFQPMDRLDFLEGDFFEMPQKASESAVFMLPPNARARFQWTPVLYLEEWMRCYETADDVVLRILCYSGDRSGPSLDLQLMLDAEPIHPNHVGRSGRVERDEVRKMGRDKFFWVWSGRRVFAAVKKRETA